MKPATLPPITAKLDRPNWWFSRNDLIGFNWSAVIGFDYKPAGKMGYDTSSLYVYTGAGILRVSGSEAEELYVMIKERAKTL